MKFNKHTMKGIEGQKKVIFSEASPHSLDPFSVCATKAGITLCGEPLLLENTEDLKAFADAVSDAWNEHKKMKVKIVLTNEAGH